MPANGTKRLGMFTNFGKYQVTATVRGGRQIVAVFVVVPVIPPS
jgi:hypothetical protein